MSARDLARQMLRLEVRAVRQLKKATRATIAANATRLPIEVSEELHAAVTAEVLAICRGVRAEAAKAFCVPSSPSGADDAPRAEAAGRYYAKAWLKAATPPTAMREGSGYHGGGGSSDSYAEVLPALARIASFEVVRAWNDEHRRNAEALPNFSFRQKWIAILDPKLCKACKRMSGTYADARGEFAEGWPPLHGDCRCFIDTEIESKTMADIKSSETPDAIPVAKKKRKKTIRVRADIAHGGSLHVRHMTDVMLEGVPVTLADGESDKVWIQLAKAGAFKGHASGPFELDAKVFGDIVRNFRATSNRAIPIDFEHASESDPTQGSIPTHGAPAQGWIVDLKIDGGALYGLVEWGDKAREYIKSGAYKFFSPAIRFGARDRVSGAQIGARMTSGALTNNPFLDGMMPLAAKDTAAPELTIERLRAMVATDPNRTLADALIECDGGDDEAAGDVEDDDPAPIIAAPAKETTMSETNATTIALSEAQTKVAELSLKLKDESARADTAETDLKALSDWKNARETKDFEERVELAFGTYKDARKLNDADKEAMLIVLKAKPETFEKQYPKVPPALAHLQRNLTEHRETNLPTDATTDTTDAQLESETPGQTISRLMSEKNISYLAASNLASKLRA